jgi:cell division protein FtsL
MKLDNSQIVRERDPQASRDLLFFFLLVALLVGGLGLYAWPHLELRRTGIETEGMQRERDRLREENRKLRLEKAALEDLRRIEKIAEKQLGLRAPQAQDVYVVEAPRPLPEGSQLASADAASGARN